MKQTDKLRFISFFLIFAFLASFLPRRLRTCDENRNTPKGSEFQSETQDLDAVFIGSSYVYSFWEPPLAWEDAGIAVFSYTSSAMPAAAMQYIMADCIKTQPEALYILEVKTFLNTPTASDLHYLFDYMPASTNRMLAKHACARYADLTLGEEIELYVPLFLFHSNWELVYDNRDAEAWGLKGAGNYPMFWESTPMTDGLHAESTGLTEKQFDALSSLLDYCDETGVRVLFTATPSYITDDMYFDQLDQIGEKITERGYTFLNFAEGDMPEQIGIDPEEDYYNAGHTNIGGAVKFTDYFTDYLVETYQFTDKRGMEGWENWDASVEQYKAVIEEYVPQRWAAPPLPHS